MDALERLRPALKRWFEARDDVVMAFLFGSQASGKPTLESDVDVAVYFRPEEGRLEWEEQRTWPGEEPVWRAVEEITGLETDLVVLNRAAATIAFAVLSDGIPLVIKDPSLYQRFYLRISAEAEDFRDFARDFWEIKQRSRSLGPIDRDRLVRILDFLEAELADIGDFTGLDPKRYALDAPYRRNVERWAENMINAAIDIAKILLSAGGQRIPQTYRQALENLALLDGFNGETAAGLARFARMRNLPAHEYLDLRHRQLAAFVQETGPLFRGLLDYTRARLER